MIPGGNKLQIFLEVDARDGVATIRDFGKASDETGKSVDRAGRFMRQTGTAADRLRRTVRRTTSVISGFGRGIRRVVSNVFSLRGALVGLGLGFVAKSFLDVARETENYQVRLSTLLGSQQAANQAMRTFEQIARTVPFSLGQVVDAGTQLEAFGASHQVWLKPLTDLAAVMGLTLPEAASALGRAYAGGAGAADIFRERGILQILRDTHKLRGGLDDITKLSLPEFRKLMLETFTDTDGRIAGAADKLAKTWDGMISMLSDAWYRFRKAVMGAGLYDYLKGGLQSVLSWIAEKERDGSFTRWAEQLSKAAIRAFKTVKSWLQSLSDWWESPAGQSFYNGIKDIAKALLGVVTALPQAISIFRGSQGGSLPGGAPINPRPGIFAPREEFEIWRQANRILMEEWKDTFKQARKYLDFKAPIGKPSGIGSYLDIGDQYQMLSYFYGIDPTKGAKYGGAEGLFKKYNKAHDKLISDMVKRETDYFVTKEKAENSIYQKIQKLRLTDKQYALWSLDQEVAALRRKGADELLIRQYVGLQTREINKTALEKLIDDWSNTDKQLEALTINSLQSIQQGFKTVFRELIETGKVTWKTIFDALINVAESALSQLGTMLTGSVLGWLFGKKPSGGGSALSGLGQGFLGKAGGWLWDALGLGGSATMGISPAALDTLADFIGATGGLGGGGGFGGGIFGGMAGAGLAPGSSLPGSTVAAFGHYQWPALAGGTGLAPGSSLPGSTVAAFGNYQWPALAAGSFGPPSLAIPALDWAAITEEIGTAVAAGVTSAGVGVTANMGISAATLAGLPSTLGAGGVAAGGLTGLGLAGLMAVPFAVPLMAGLLFGEDKGPEWYQHEIEVTSNALERMASQGVQAVDQEMERLITHMDAWRDDAGLTAEQYEAMWAGASNTMRQYREQVEETRKVTGGIGGLGGTATQLGENILTGPFAQIGEAADPLADLQALQYAARNLAQELGLTGQAVDDFIAGLEPTSESVQMAQEQFRQWANQVGAARFQAQELAAAMQQGADVTAPAFSAAISNAASAIGLTESGAESLKNQLAQIAERFQGGEISAADLSGTIESTLIGAVETMIGALQRAENRAESFGDALRSIPDKITTDVYVNQHGSALIGHQGGDIGNLPRYHRGGLNHDERLVVGQTGEVFWSRTDNARWGGASNVDRMRRLGPSAFRGGGGGDVIYLTVQGMTLDDPAIAKKAARKLGRYVLAENSRLKRLRVGG